MKVELRRVTVRGLVAGYKDTAEEGVYGYEGRLNIRPKYQREFVYTPDKQEAVIHTVLKNRPLNTMYWAVNDSVDAETNAYEVIDGQQRTLSLCRYAHGVFPIQKTPGDFKFFSNLSLAERACIEDYELMVYFCRGTEEERLAWFTTINIAGEKLTNQELRNSVYAGAWLTDAKRRFSKTGCPAYVAANQYMSGTPIRQDYLETVLKWASKGEIERYMADNQHKPNANVLWLYFKKVIDWVESTFPEYRREMKGIQWGPLYDVHGHRELDPATLEAEVKRLMQDEDVTSKKGIYEYLLDGNPKHLNIRSFSPRQRREAYERQGGVCAVTGEALPLEEMEADHITPWHEGGPTTAENCQMISKHANRTKSGR